LVIDVADEDTNAMR